MKKSAGADPLEFDLDPAQPEETAGIQLEFDASGGSADEEDVTAFDPFGAESGAAPPEAPRPAAPAKPKPLRLDFSEVIDHEDVRGAQRIGSSMLDTGAFMDKEQLEALERAKRATRAEAAPVIELEEERRGAVRVVAENRSVWVWFGIAAAAAVLLAVGAVFFLHQQRQAKLEAELQRLIEADRAHRDADVRREQELKR